MSKTYDQRFFDWVNFTGARSARQVIPLLIEHVRPASVLDVGCGQGAWLAAWRELGITDVIGVDGNYVEQDDLLIPREHFVARDLTERLSLDRRFDLVQSLEVAEHLRPEASDFLSTRCAPTVTLLPSRLRNPVKAVRGISTNAIFPLGRPRSRAAATPRSMSCGHKSRTIARSIRGTGTT